MTWAQGTFAFCFGILVPLVGFWCAKPLRQAKKPWFLRFLLCASAMFAAMLGCCALALLFFPHYPQQYVHEWLANAFTLPALLAGIALLRFITRKDAVPESLFRQHRLKLIGIYALGICLTYNLLGWDFRKELPLLASDVHEHFYADGFLPDYSYFLKAKMSEQQFQRYIAKFKLTLHTPDRKYSEDLWLDWGGSHLAPLSWWDPGKTLEHTYVWEGGDTWTFAKYEHGYLYLKSLNH